MPASPPHHPVVVEHAARRAADILLRIADAITAFPGSMQEDAAAAIAVAKYYVNVAEYSAVDTALTRLAADDLAAGQSSGAS
jgi:hypothetical protein